MSQQLLDIAASLLENLPEYSMSLDCVGWKYKEGIYKFVDTEDGARYTLTVADLAATLAALPADADIPAFPAGVLANTADEDAIDYWLCCADAGIVDTLIQLTLFKKVVYA